MQYVDLETIKFQWLNVDKIVILIWTANSKKKERKISSSNRSKCRKGKRNIFNRINIVSTYLTDKYIHIFIYKNVGDRQKKSKKKKKTTKTKPQFSPNLIKRRKKNQTNLMKHVPPSGNTRVTALLQSPMNAVCTPTPPTALAAPRHTPALILRFPTERNARAAGKRKILVQNKLPASYWPPTQTPNLSACGLTWFYSSLYWNAVLTGYIVQKKGIQC